MADVQRAMAVARKVRKDYEAMLVLFDGLEEAAKITQDEDSFRRSIEARKRELKELRDAVKTSEEELAVRKDKIVKASKEGDSVYEELVERGQTAAEEIVRLAKLEEAKSRKTVQDADREMVRVRQEHAKEIDTMKREKTRMEKDVAFIKKELSNLKARF